MNAWHKLLITEAASLLAADLKHELSVCEAKNRLARYGQNKLRKGKQSVLAINEYAISELTTLIAFHNLSSKFNTALGMEPQGFRNLPKER